MVFKRALDVLSNEWAKRSKLNSKVLLKSNEKKAELLDLTEEQDQTIELDSKSDNMVFACKNGHLEIVEWHLKHDFDVNSRDSSNNTALHHAAANGQLVIVKKLLENGALLDLANTSHFTPLHLASLNGHTQVLRELLKQNVDVNLETKHGENALDFAARNGHLDAVKELLKSGAEAYIEEEDSYEFPFFEKLPLKHFSENEIAIMVEILKSHPYPLHQAILELEIPQINLIIERLLKSGISPDLQDKYGDTALHRAVMDDTYNYEGIAELLKHGVNMEIKNIYHETPLHVAFENNQTELEKGELIKELLKHGADPNSFNGTGNTLLHEAISSGNISITKILLEHGVNVNVNNHIEKTPLHLAVLASQGDRELVIKELLRNDANVNLKDSEGYTPIHEAAFYNYMPEYLVIDFLKRCTDLNVKDFDGRTPLHIAISEDSQSNVGNLLRYGADANVRTFEGCSSFENSLIHEQIGTFKVLIYNN